MTVALHAQEMVIVDADDDYCYYGAAMGVEIVVNDSDAVMVNAAVVVDSTPIHSPN